MFVKTVTAAATALRPDGRDVLATSAAVKSTRRGFYSRLETKRGQARRQSLLLERVFASCLPNDGDYGLRKRTYTSI